MSAPSGSWLVEAQADDLRQHPAGKNRRRQERILDQTIPLPQRPHQNQQALGRQDQYEDANHRGVPAARFDKRTGGALSRNLQHRSFAGVQLTADEAHVALETGRSDWPWHRPRATTSRRGSCRAAVLRVVFVRVAVVEVEDAAGLEPRQRRLDAPPAVTAINHDEIELARAGPRQIIKVGTLREPDRGVAEARLGQRSVTRRYQAGLSSTETTLPARRANQSVDVPDPNSSTVEWAARCCATSGNDRQWPPWLRRPAAGYPSPRPRGDHARQMDQLAKRDRLTALRVEPRRATKSAGHDPLYDVHLGLLRLRATARALMLSRATGALGRGGLFDRLTGPRLDEPGIDQACGPALQSTRRQKCRAQPFTPRAPGVEVAAQVGRDSARALASVRHVDHHAIKERGAEFV